MFSITSRKHLYRAFKQLQLIDVLLKKFDITVNYKMELEKSWTLVYVLISVFIRTVLVLQAIHNTELIEKATLFFAMLSKSMYVIIFVRMLISVEQRFVQLNNHIHSLYYNTENCKTVSNDVSLPTKLTLIYQLYWELCNTAKTVNSLMSYQMISCTFSTLSSLVFQLYYLYYMVTRNAAHSLYFGIPVIWLFDKSRTTPRYLHELRNKTTSINVDKYVHKYSLQMLLQKVSFDAGRFFKMNNSLVYGILSATVSYIIVIIQYDQQSRILYKNDPNYSLF